MVFVGTPNMLIVDRQKKKKYRFDSNGEFETGNERLIKKLSGKFRSKPTVIIGSVSQHENFSTFSKIADPEKYPDEFACPKCSKVCKNASGLSAHVRACKE